MRTHRFSKFFLLFLSSILISALLPVFGQEDGSATEEAEMLTQGQAAVVIARRVGLLNNATAVPTQTSAIQMLSARGVSPKDGWDADALLTTGELARLLVQALGLESDLSEAQIAGDDSQPYIDLLIEKYGVDVREIRTAREVAASLPGSNGITDPLKDVETDPLEIPPFSGGENGEKHIPVSLRTLEATFDGIASGSGGRSGGGGSSNMTPSAP